MIENIIKGKYIKVTFNRNLEEENKREIYIEYK